MRELETIKISRPFKLKWNLAQHCLTSVNGLS